MLVGVPPKIFYTGSSDGPLDPTKRSFPGSWVLLEVEVNKMKSSTEKKNKDKKEDKPVMKNTVPFESADIDTATNTNNSNNNSNSDLATRMARVAQQGHGGGANSQLAGIMSSQRSPGSGNSGDFQRKSFTNSSNNNSDGNNRNNNGSNNDNNRSFNNNTNNNNNNNNNSQDRQQGGDRYRDDDNQDRHYNSNNNRNNYNNNNNNSNSRNNYHNDNNNQYNDQRRSYNSNNNNDYQENRVAVIEGQGARSYYDAEDDGNHHNNRYNNNNSSNYNSRPAPASAPVANPAPAVSAADSALTATGLIQLHQSVAAVQQSMLQLHTKLDQVCQFVYD